MDTGSFIIYINTDDTLKVIAKDVKTRFDTSNYELERPLPKEKHKKVIGLIKDELDGRMIKEFSGLRTKTYSYLRDNGSADKKAKGIKKQVIKRKLKFEDYKNCLEATQLENKINHLENNEIEVNSLKKDHKEFIEKQ